MNNIKFKEIDFKDAYKFNTWETVSETPAENGVIIVKRSRLYPEYMIKYLIPRLIVDETLTFDGTLMINGKNIETIVSEIVDAKIQKICDAIYATIGSNPL